MPAQCRGDKDHFSIPSWNISFRRFFISGKLTAWGLVASPLMVNLLFSGEKWLSPAALNKQAVFVPPPSMPIKYSIIILQRIFVYVKESIIPLKFFVNIQKNFCNKISVARYRAEITCHSLCYKHSGKKDGVC
jgi:hypothetical protein